MGYVRSPCFILFKIGSLLWNLEFFFFKFILESSIFRSNTVTVRKEKLNFFFILFKIGSLLWNLEFFFQKFFILESSIFRSNTVTVRKKKIFFFLHRKRHVTSQ